MSGIFKGQDLFTCHVSSRHVSGTCVRHMCDVPGTFSIHVITNPRLVTFHMYFPMFLTLSFNPSLNVPTMYPHIPCGLHLFLSCIASCSISYSQWVEKQPLTWMGKGDWCERSKDSMACCGDNDQYNQSHTLPIPTTKPQKSCRSAKTHHPSL